MDTTPTPTTGMREAVHTALLELLTTGAHHAATPATLHAIATTRRTLATVVGTRDPAARHAPDERRLAALTQALGDIGAALLAAPIPAAPADPTDLRDALAELAAVALAWLDTLPEPESGPDPWDSDDGYTHDPDDPSPF